MDIPSAELLDRCQGGDETAADEMFRRYIGRLTALARGRIARRLSRRIDPEDVAHSAYRSFFVRARSGRVTLEESGDLWRLLVAITINKVNRTVQHHRAAKRSVDREQGALTGFDGKTPAWPRLGHQPTVEEVAILAEEFEQFTADLESLERSILELRMQDHSQRDIALRVKRSERTVRRILKTIEERLARRLLDHDDASNPATHSTTRSANDVEHDFHRDASAEEHRGNFLETRGSHSQHGPTIAGEWLSDTEFQVARHLGTGGTGKVYEAWWRTANEWVAVKVLKKRSQSNPVAVRRFLDEAKTVAELLHPGIVPVRGIGRLRSGGCFLVFDLAAGGDLASLTRLRRIETAEALQWVHEAAVAVDHAHRRGVVHCDLKPSNLLLDRSGHVRVIDFGFAHVLRESQSRSGVGGTFGFMAPEQLEATLSEIGPWTDVFGLGAVLYTLVAGQAPFATANDRCMARRSIVAGPALLSSLRSDIDGPLDAICRQCLANDRRERFGTAADLANAIEALR